MAEDKWYEKPEDLTSSRLIAAAANGELETIQSLFEPGYPNKNETTNHGSTTINIAAWKGHLSVVRFLAEHVVDPEIVDKMGYSALHVAAVGGNLDVLVSLAEQGADKNSSNTEGKTPILTAAKSKHFDIVRYLARQGVNVNVADNKDDLTPLIAVITALHVDDQVVLDTVRCLVEQGADVEKAKKDGKSPLYLASYTGRPDVVRYLLEQGANKDKDKEDNDGITPLIAAFKGTMMFRTTAKKIHDIVTCLVGHGADMEKVDEGGKTALIIASMHGIFYLDLIRFLLEQGANRDKADNKGMTPLHWAAKHGFLEITKLLMVYGANLNAENDEFQLPIHVAYSEAIRQAIRDEPRRRMDEAPGKRATEEDRHPNAATSASAQEEEDDEEGEQQNSKKPRLDEGAEVEDGKVAEEDEDSEPSSDEDDGL